MAFVPSLKQIPDAREKKQPQPFTRPGNRKQNFQSPILAFKTIPELSLPPTPPLFPGTKLPHSPNESLFNFILFHALLVQGIFFPSSHPLLSSSIYFFATPPSLISFHPPTVTLHVCNFLLTLMALVSPQYLSGTRQK